MQKGGKPKNPSISTEYTFHCKWAFDQLGGVRKRLNLNRIGFGSSDEQSQVETSAANFLGKAETRDFIDYGFELNSSVVCLFVLRVRN